MMKNIFKIVLLGWGILSVAACSDFLNQGSPSELNNGTVFNSTYYASLSLNKVYGDLTKDETYSQYLPIVWGLNTDCELVDGLGQSNVSNSVHERGAMNYNVSPGWSNISKMWNAMYGIIENANITIEGIEGSSLITTEGSDKTTMLRMKGEALTLRAMIYFDLIKSFGDIPMNMESTQSDLSNVYLRKTDRDEIMDRLITDLEEAVIYLPWAGEASYTTEHVTKGYAHALLAHIALTRAGWNIRELAKTGYETAASTDATYPTQRCSAEKRDEMYKLALAHLSTLINSGVHRLNPSIENHWYQINQRTLDGVYRENLFEIPMGLGKSGELGYTVGIRINGSSSYYGSKGNSSGKLKLTAPYFWSFDKKDLRRDLTCAMYELKEESGVLKEVMLSNKPFDIYCAKWDIRKMNEEWRTAAKATSDKCPTGINAVRMRYAHVLLMYAEVMNELNGPDVAGTTGLSARDALTMVHARSFEEADKAMATQYIADITADNFFNAIVDENAWELAGEGFRKYDLIRWNLLSEKIDQFKTDYENQMAEYPQKLYYKFKPNTFELDMTSFQWYAEPAVTDGYESVDFFGKANTTNATNLPLISSGLNASVKNRYLLPIASTTISASNGTLHNSYGFTD